MFSRILVATDNCPAVGWAIRYAAVLFPRASFHLLSVLDVSDKTVPPVEAMVCTLEEECKEAIESGRRILREMGVEKVTTSSPRGVPSKEILKYIREHEIELLVISRHAKEGSQKIHLGGTFRRVMEHVHCPVLIVPGEIPLSVPKTVFNPTSGSVYSMSASEMAALLADHFGASMHTLYVGPPDDGRVLSTVRAIAEKLGVPFTGERAEGSPEREILRGINRFDVTVMSRGYRGLRYRMRFLKRSLALGPLERIVLAETGKPIMVVGD
ncbi:MAG: universal stress protein [Thermoplasmata archaeon]|nr:universal stress protein [Thermoplasmata archaeon]